MPPDASQDLAELEAGLDALQVIEERGPSGARRLATAVLPPCVALLGFLALWQLVAALELKPSYVIPSPLDVWRTISDQWSRGSIAEAIGTSLQRAGFGFAVSVVAGTVLGLALARVRLLRLGLQPLVAALQSLPSVAWVPAAIIWFGLTDGAIYFVVLMGAVPSIAVGLVSGVDQIPPLFLRVGQVLGARRLTALRHIVLPAALPSYVGGLKQGWAFAWRSLMAAELITFSPELGFGLGQLLDSGRQLSDMSLVFGSIIVILGVGIGVELLVFAPLERSVLRRRGLRRA